MYHLFLFYFLLLYIYLLDFTILIYSTTYNS